MFKKCKITLNHVRDKIYASEGDEELELRIDEDAMLLAKRIKKVFDDMGKAKTDPDKLESAAIRFGKAVFGEEQTEKLLSFYSGNPFAVLEFTSKYFTGRLSEKIVRAQRHAKTF